MAFREYSDAGQCNDSYSLALIALKLKEIFNLNSINELPLLITLHGNEQKAVIGVACAALFGCENIHLDPRCRHFFRQMLPKCW